jgi:hypothetical protein
MKRTDTLWTLAALAIVGAAIVSPFFFLGNASGQDFDFHAAAWLDVAAQWRLGVFFPRWAEWANWGHGEPRFIFYPPLSWMLGAMLGLILPWNAVPGAFIWLAVVASGMAMRSFAGRWLSPRGAFFAALFYAANPYVLLVVYHRSDFAELLALALFPLLANEVLRSGAAAAKNVPRLALVFAAIWLCNAPAGVLAAYSLCFLIAVVSIQTKSVRPLAAGASAIVLGFLLAAFYIVPAAYEQSWVNIAQVLSSGLMPADNFLFTTIDDPDHNLFNVMASTLAVGMMAIAGFAAVAARRDTEPAKAESRVAGAAMLALAAVCAVMMFPVTAPLWRWLPKLRFVQFPWRWAGLLGVSMAYFLAAVAARKRWRWIVGIFLLATYAGTGAFLVGQASWDSDTIPDLRQAIANDAGYEGTDEYDPLGDDRTDLPKNAPRAAVLPADGSAELASAKDAARIRIERWMPEEKLIRVEAREPAQIALRLLNYPAWRVEVDGQPVRVTTVEGTAQMVVPVHAGENLVRVWFVRTADRITGGLLSLLGAALLLLFWTSSSVRNHAGHTHLAL